MTNCQHCHKPLPAARPGQKYCRTSCQSAAHARRKRQEAATQPRVEVAITLTEQPGATPPSGLSAEEVRALVFGYALPEPFSIDPMSGEPVWRFRELAELFGISQIELRDVLVARGQPFLRVSIGTSAGMLARG